jgi:hypothetical protein
MNNANLEMRQTPGGRALYRARQFFGALRPVVRQEELLEAERVLGRQLMTLFASMSGRDQRHCLDVYEKLLGAGCEDAEVLTAALLHDAGKGSLAGKNVRLWHRVAYVMLENGPKSGVELASRANGGIATLRDHGERGAVLADAFGASPEVVHLLREMERKRPDDPRAALLKAADEAS